MGEYPSEATLDLLLVEDNRGDVRLLQEALREGDAPCRLHVATDGEKALAFLRREAGHAEVPRPDLILLDLNVPRRPGAEVLAEIKGDPDLRRIPVIVMSTSAAAHEVRRAYDLHANCYILKPFDLDAFLRQIRLLREFWCGLVRLPREADHAR